MAQRVQQYLNEMVDVLDARSKVAGNVGHNADHGANREHLVEELVDQHLPYRLKATLGGRAISHEDEESGQVDVLVSDDLGPRFQAHGRTFMTAESVALAVSVTSILSTTSLEDALTNLWSIPQPSPDLLTFSGLQGGRASQQEQPWSDDWCSSS